MKPSEGMIFAVMNAIFYSSLLYAIVKIAFITAKVIASLELTFVSRKGGEVLVNAV